MEHDEKGIILIVEDEDSIRLTLRDYLRKKGYKVLVASDGVGAIKQLLDFSISVVVTDYRMEIFGGDYWIKFLKKYCPDLKVIITSGFLRPDFEIPYEVIFKPFDYAALEEKVRTALTNQQADAKA
jgi:DNA-binding NtrC family response regulator